jgi:hypothetical protein
MSAEALRDLADRIAGGSGAEERSLFEQAMTAFDLAGDRRSHCNRHLHLDAFNELAIALYRSACADAGFQFGMTASDVNTSAMKGLAHTWRAGDAHASTHRAATPALALLLAAATERADQLDAVSAGRCPDCRGLGWFISTANRKVVCRHERCAA